MTDASESLGDLLAWLDRHINLERIEANLAGRAAEPTLTRIRALCAAMGDPQDDYPAVHVTGTNGKGSTTRMTTALLMAQGLTAGTLTSPSLELVNERICRDLEPISDADLAEVLSALRDLEEFVLQGDPSSLRPNYFEVLTAAAYRYFSDAAVEAAVVEVGMGGKWDASNVINGRVAVITNVDLDHVEILGPTRRHIATEKSGIIKAGATVVVGDEDPEIVDIFAAEAQRVGAAEFWRRGFEFECTSNRVAYGGRVIDVRTPGTLYRDLFVPLFGAHQGLNASTAITAAEAFFGGPLEEEVVIEALNGVTVPGRLEVVSREPLTILDGAHNAHGAAALGAALREDFAAVGRVVVVMGCLRSHDAGEMLDAMGLERVAHLVATQPASPRAAAASSIAAAATARGLATTTIEDVDEAIRAALDLSGDDDLVLVMGSLYTVGAARGFFRRLGSPSLRRS